MRAREEFVDTLTDRVRALPGVAGVTQGAGAPPEGGNIAFGADLRSRRPRRRARRSRSWWSPSARCQPTTSRSWAFRCWPARGFSADDVRGRAAAIVINQEMATRLWQRRQSRRPALRLDVPAQGSVVHRRGRRRATSTSSSTRGRATSSPTTFRISQYQHVGGQRLVVRSATIRRRSFRLFEAAGPTIDPDQPSGRPRHR